MFIKWKYWLAVNQEDADFFHKVNKIVEVPEDGHIILGLEFNQMLY